MKQPLIVPPMTQEQIRILDKPVKDLTEEEAFANIPLACRLTKGIDYVNQINDKQIQILTERAANADSDEMPPEVRVDMDNFRGIQLAFTQTMKIPDSVIDEMQEDAQEQDGTEEGVARRLARRGGGAARRMDVVGIRGEEPEDEDYNYIVVDGWENPSIDENGISLRLKMSDPLHVSLGEDPDYIFVQLELNDTLTENGIPMQSSVVKKILVTSQIRTQAEADSVDATGYAGRDFTSYACF